MAWSSVRCRGRGLDDYPLELQDGYHAELGRLVSELDGSRVVHLNATPAGGGVAEILKSLIPLKRSVGVDALWSVIPPADAFFGVTRKMHDLFQGGEGALTRAERDIYFSHLGDVARLVPTARWQPDAWFVHDPQLVPLVEHLPQRGLKVWICHVDTTVPNRSVIEMLLPYMKQYDRVVFSLPQYVLDGLDRSRIAICPPAIDPLRRKNSLLRWETARARVAQYGLDPKRPLLAQIARYDLWKDPLGVIDAYRIIKRSLPGVQLALVGALTATDDPMGAEVLEMTRAHAGDDPDIHLFWDPVQINDNFVNTFQTAPDVVYQKSTREGFGLTVTEAMWKGRPVIGGDVGGIRIQIKNGVSGFTVSSVEECAQRSLEILADPELARRLGRSARKSVIKKFLMPRLMRDYMRLMA